MGTTNIPAGTRTPAPGAWNSALQSLLLAATALFVLNFHVLGTLDASTRISQDLIYAKFGNQPWLYPRYRGGDQGDHSHPSVVAVIINEAALALRNAHWPVSMQFHAQFLAELGVLKPRAIMLDFLLLDRASPADTCELLNAAAELRANGTRLYLAVTRSADLQILDAPDCRDDAGKPLDANRLFMPVSVSRQVDRFDFVNRLYPFTMREPGEPRATGLASAAVRMYCDSTPASAQCLSRLTERTAPGAGFDLAWSPAGDDFNKRWLQADCAQVLSPIRAIFGRDALPRDNPCPPVPTLFASAILSPVQDPTLGAGNEQLFKLLDGSFVLVGGNFRGSGDLMSTPMHTLLPGVYYHAVALENLIAFDGRPKVRKEYRHPKIGYYLYDLGVLWTLAAIFLFRQRWVERHLPHIAEPFMLSAKVSSWIESMTARLPTTLWVVGAAVLLLLLAVYKVLQRSALLVTVLLLVLVELRIATKADIKERLHCLALYLAALLVSLAVVAVAVWVGYRWLRLPPGDWIGYLSFAAVGFFVAHTGILEFERHVAERRTARAKQAEN